MFLKFKGKVQIHYRRPNCSDPRPNSFQSVALEESLIVDVIGNAALYQTNFKIFWPTKHAPAYVTFECQNEADNSSKDLLSAKVEKTKSCVICCLHLRILKLEYQHQHRSNSLLKTKVKINQRC